MHRSLGIAEYIEPPAGDCNSRSPTPSVASKPGEERMAEQREIGRTGLRVPPIAFGTSGLGNMPETYGYEVEEARALATVRAILDRADGFLDTSRNYGRGRSEERVGMVVRELGGWPEG